MSTQLFWMRGISAGAVILSANVANACPNCATAMADGNHASAGSFPMAFYYSILFLLSMPFILTAGFGYMFYRLSRQQVASSHTGMVGSRSPTAEEPVIEHWTAPLADSNRFDPTGPSR